MFVVEPNAVVAAFHPDDFDNLGIGELPQREDAYKLVLC